MQKYATGSSGNPAVRRQNYAKPALLDTVDVYDLLFGSYRSLHYPPLPWGGSQSQVGG
jgi:hypothetical protein